MDAALPLPDTSALDDLLRGRASTRDFGSPPLELAELGALLWAASGLNDRGGRVAPSAHALYPITVTAVVGDLRGLPAGTYGYAPDGHGLSRGAGADQRAAVARTSLVDGDWLSGADAILVLSADFPAVREHFAEQPPLGVRGERYLWLEAGHMSQNAYLKAAELDLAAVLVGGFDDDAIRAVRPAVLPAGHSPLALIGIGRR